MEYASADMEKMALEEGADRKLLIAVDFGTTFSGVAWAQTRRVCLSVTVYHEYNLLIISHSQTFRQSSSSGLTTPLAG